MSAAALPPVRAAQSGVRPVVRRRRPAAWLALLLGAAALATAQAQYRVVGPDGRVTYTDRPPSYQSVPSARGASNGPGGEAATLAALSAGLPFALRQVVERYPVRLYTTSPCAPCDAARQSLRRRGVPLLEYSVNRPEDLERYQREVGAGELPAMTVGGQRHIGFSEADWQLTLDSAGYPASSQLPAGYRWVPVRPLAPERAAATADRPAPAQPAAPRPAARPAAEPAPAANPDGFRF
jgi:glutaredoxin